MHKRIVNEQWVLDKDIEEYAGNVHGGPKFEFCFERKDRSSVPQFDTIDGSVATAIRVSQCLSNAYE